MSRRWMRRWFAIAGALLVLAAACGDDKGDGQATPGTGAGGSTTSTTLVPQKGGIVTVGQFSREPGLDPAKLAGGGTVGGMEHMAIYDVIMRYNNVTGKYEPRTAESLTSNADFSVWTLKLKANIKFTDGNPYDANAVKYVHEREIKEGNAAPKGQLTQTIQSIDVVDPLTVRYTLKQPWVGFPYILSGVNGLIYSPAAQQKAGANFNTAPGDAGAGPFKVKAYKPQESVELERNASYWGGEPYLDGLKFILLSAGADANYEALKGGSLQAAFIRDNFIYADAKKNGYGTIEMPAVAGNILNMNSAKGATANVKVRQAVAHAVDPKAIVDRVYKGAGQPDSAPFANFPWDPKVQGRKYDVAEARRLFNEAKSEGFDGKLRVLSANTQEGIAWGQAVQAGLQAAGIEVSLDTSKDTQGVVAQVLVQNDYDVATWAYGLLDESDGNYLQLIGTFGGKRYGYGPPDMVAAVDQLRTADTDAKKVAAYKAISDIWIRDEPAHVTTAIMQVLVTSPKLHDAQRTAASSILFDKAWLAK